MAQPQPQPSPGSRVPPRTDWFTRSYLIASGLIMAALVVVVVLLGLSNRAIAQREDANLIRSCQQGNDDRATDEQIFREILALPAISSPQFITPANAVVQRAAVAKIRSDISEAYASRNCVAEYSTK
jgi:hypothetical protein